MMSKSEISVTKAKILGKALETIGVSKAFI